MTVIIFIIILAILILVHELGHFGTAKFFGIKVDEFGLGFPPKLWSKKVGETLYTLNLLPLGGFVRIFGEDPHNTEIAPEEKHRSFYYKPKWVQAIVLVAGIVMNIFFGYLLISAGYMIGLPVPASAYPNDVRDTALVITSVMPGSPADKIGLASGDVILGIAAGKNIVRQPTPEIVSDLISKSQSPVVITYGRGNHIAQNATITPITSVSEGRPLIGITMDEVGVVRFGLGKALVEGAKTSATLIKGITIGLGQFFGNLITLNSGLAEVSGPVGIARAVGQASSIGFVYLLIIVALISFNLAIINLIPFPALDGGRLLFVLIESITRKNINRKFATYANAIGFIFLLSLMVIVTAHDIFNLF